MIAISGTRGCIDMGIDIHATVAEALTHRRRRHRADHLNQMETQLEEIRIKGLVETEDVVL